MASNSLRSVRPLPLEAHAVVATRLLEGLADGSLSAREVARLVESDSALSIRVVRLANAPYYGAAGQVASAARAVLLLGMSTVQGIVATAAWRLLGDDLPVTPPGYLGGALATAAATSVLARELGFPVQDCFTLGLLHDVGRLIDDPDGDHARAGAAVLGANRFPAPFLRAVIHHHHDVDLISDPLTRVLVAGRALAASVIAPPEPPPPDPERALKAVGLGARDVGRLVRELEQDIEALHALTWGQR